MEPTKVCSKCGTEKPLSDFYFKRPRKLRLECKTCYKEEAKIRSRIWRVKNPGRQIQAIKRWREKNKERSKKTRIIWKKKSGTGQRNTRISHNLRTRMLHAMKGINKSEAALKLLGCSLAFFRRHLEKQFQPDMTWENYGRAGWHIDHIKPCAKFDLTDPAQQRVCFHFSNLQPLWAFDNLKKNKYA